MANPNANLDTEAQAAAAESLKVSSLSSKVLAPFHVMIQIEPCKPAPEVKRPVLPR